MSSLTATQADGYYLPVGYYELCPRTNGMIRMLMLTKERSNPTARTSRHRRRLTPPPRSGPVRVACVGNLSRMQDHHGGEQARGLDSMLPKFGRMKCIFHSNLGISVFNIQTLVIRTDPAVLRFRYVSGMTKVKQERQDITEESQTATREPIEMGFERLEQKQAALTQRQELQALLQANEVTHKNDADGNATIRATFRFHRSTAKNKLLITIAAGFWLLLLISASLLPPLSSLVVEGATATTGMDAVP
jgi:hypothetical protein